MQELLEKLLDEFRGAWRFRWIAMITAWLVALAGWAFVLLMPDTYEASARVFVDSRTLLKQVTQGFALDQNIDTQIQRVRQALLGGPQIEKVAREAFPEFSTVTPERRQLLVSGLRERISIASSRDNATAGVYMISYTDENRDRSVKIVDRLLTTFVEGSLGGNREDSQKTQRFLVDQIAEYEQRLRAAEDRQADFRRQNVGLMPGAQGDYFTRLQAEMTALDKARAAAAIAMSSREELQHQLTSEQPFLNGADGVRSGTGAPGITGGNDTASQIQDTQRRLDELLLRFTDKHPDVIALRETLANLKERRQAELDAVRRGEPGAAARLGLNSNPVYQDIQRQQNRTDVDIAALGREIVDHQNKIAGLNKLVNTAPEVEAEFVRLNRDYDVMRKAYQVLVEQLDRMRFSEHAEETGGAVTFQVIDPPAASLTPVAPNRPRLIITVFFAALAVAGGLAYLLHQLRPVFSSPRQLSDVTGLPVLGLVNMIWLGRYEAAARRGAVVYVSIAALLIAAATLMFIVQSDATRIVRSLIS